MLIKAQGFMNTRSNIVFLGLVVVAASANAQDNNISAQVLNREDLNPSLVQATPPKVGTTQLNQQFDYNGISLVFNEGVFADLPLQVGTSQDTVLRGGALLHKSAAERTSPFPGQTYPATSVVGVPRAVKPLRTATRIWTSAT